MPISRVMQLARRVWRGVRRRLFPRLAYRKVPMRVRAPLQGAEAPPPGHDWRDCLSVIEVDDATALAGALFMRKFGSVIPASPRHFVLLFAADAPARRGATVAYIHHQRVGEIYLTGGLCVEERAYRSLPKWLFARVREEGGLATILTRESVAMLGDGAAVFGHVGEMRSRQASLRAGFADTDDDHLMVYWREPASDADKQRLVAMAASHGPF